MEIVSTEEREPDRSLRQFPNRSQESISPTEHGFGFRRILVPLDLRSEPDAAGPVAAGMARRSGAQLVLLHAVRLNLIGEERGIERARLVKQLCAEAQAKLLCLANVLAPAHETEIVIGLGAPDELILDAAQRLNIDAIVMQTCRKSRWTQWLHRNTSREVTRRAPCTVWLVSNDAKARSTNITVLHRAPATRRGGGRVRGLLDEELTDRAAVHQPG